MSKRNPECTDDREAVASDSRGAFKGVVAAKPYEPSAKEQKALDGHYDRRKRQKPAPRVKVSQRGNTANILVDHPDEAVGNSLLMESLGTADTDFASGLLIQLGGAVAKAGTADERAVNFMLSIIRGIEPRDQLEAMLAAQMAATHNATMTFARRLHNVENIPQQDSAERAFNKLARTFTSQVEALKRYRSKGEQKVTVEHVHVHQGGQAIVGNVSHQGGGVAPKNEDQSHAKQIAHAPGTQMPREIEAERQAVPSTGG